MPSLSACFFALLLSWLPAAAGAASVYGGTDGAHHAPDTQITPENIGQLAPAWEYHTGELGELAPSERRMMSMQGTPILLPPEAGGALVFCSPLSRVVALDPATGVPRWRFDPQIRRAATRPFNCRGVAWWHAGGEGHCADRVFLASYDRRLIALDSRDGRPCAGFGNAGEVDMMEEQGAHARGDVTHPSPPVVVNGTVIVGSGVVDFAHAHAPGGAVRAFAALDGREMWRFDPIPAMAVAGEWPEGARGRSGAANTWAPISVDAARGFVFLPTSAPSPDYYGAARAGDNRHANSVVALRVSSGELVWSFQAVHHDLWDYDLPAQPVLARVDGRDVVIQLTKQGFVFVLDRDTGVPVWPVEERAVPQGAVRGERPSPTQPFPLRPAPLLPARLAPEHAWGFTPWDRGRCRDDIAALRHDGLFTPVGEDWTLMFPGSLGGPNWGGGALDAQRGLLLVNFSAVPARARLVAQTGAGAPGAVSIEGYDWRMVMSGTPWVMETGMLVSPLGVPCSAPPWGELAALDLASGQWRWRVPLGSIHELGPLPLPFEIPLGTPNLGGGLATASGLLFIGATMDRRLRAFDVNSGAQLWSATLPADAHATPMSYTVGGRQFVVVASGGHHMFANRPEADALLAFALPAP